MKCADIPDQAVIAAINQSIDVQTSKYGKTVIGAQIWNVFERFPQYPQKLVRAKLNKMVRAGKLSGCTCGCRGDFEIVGQERSCF